MDGQFDEELGSPLRWGVRKRLEFIEFQLYWYGRMTRASLVDRFEMSAQQASADISRYQSIAAGNLAYDPAQKVYLRTPNFRPRFVGDGSDRFLLQLVAIESGWMRQDETWFESRPPVEVVSLRRRATNPTHLLGILDAIRNGTALEIDYQSMTGTPQLLRVIGPHAMAYSAGRWYVRAWSREHNDFRDFNLNRIRGISSTALSSVDYALDYEWSHKIDLIVVPNPDLPDARRKAVASEYEMIDGKLIVTARLSLSFYFMSEHNLDVEPKLLSPEKQQLVLSNRSEIQQSRHLMREMSKQALLRTTPS